MALVGYEPAPNGGLLFHRDDGPSMVFMGDEAKAMKAHLDMTMPPDARTAGVDPSSVMFGSGGADNPPAPPQNMSDAGGMSSMSGVTRAPAQPMGFGPPPGPPAPPESLTPAAPAPPAPQPTREQQEAHAADLLEEAALANLRPHYSGGRPAVDPNKLNREGVPVRTVMTTTGELGGTEEEKAAREERQADYRIDRSLGMQSQNDAAAEVVTAKSLAEQAAIVESERTKSMADAAAAKSAAVDGEWNKVAPALYRERAAATKMEVDPKRLFRGDAGTVNAITSALGVALGAFGASISGGPNYALQMVDAAIQRDINAQQDQIHRRGAAADNAISEYQSRFNLSHQEATLAAQSTAARWAAAHANATATKIGTAEAKMSAAALSASLIDKANEWDTKLETLHKGTTATQYVNVQPQAAQRGGLVGPTTKQIGEAADTVGKVKKAFGNKPEAEDIKAQAEARHAQNDEDKNVQEYGKRKAEIDKGNSVLRDYIQSMGGSVNSEKNVEWNDMDIPDTGPIAGRTPAFSDDARKVEQLRSWLTQETGQVLSGASVSKEQQKGIDELLNPTNEAGARRGAEILLRKMREAEKENDAAFGPKVTRTFGANKDETSRDRERSSKSDKVRPAGVIQ